MSVPVSARKKKKPKVLVLYNRPERSTPVARTGEEAAQPLPPPRRLYDIVDVVEGLRANGFDVAHHNVDDDPDRVMWSVVVERPDLVYNLVDNLEGDFTHHATVTSFYYLLGVPYTGSEPFVLTLSQDRARSHVLLDDAGIPLPQFGVVRDVNAVPDTTDFKPPLIVTQTFDDIYYDEGFEHPLHVRPQVEERVANLAREFELPLLIEEYIVGRRLHAIVIGNRALEILPLTETEPPDEEELEELAEAAAEALALAEAGEDAEVEEDAEAELEAGADPEAGAEAAAETGTGAEAGLDVDGAPVAPDPEAHAEADAEAEEEEYVFPEEIYLAQLDQDTADHVRTLARRAFRVMGCRDCAQIDLHLDEDGMPYVVDVRPSFDHLPGSPFQIAADSTDRGFGGTVAEIARVACRRARILQEEPVQHEHGAPEAQATGTGGAPASAPGVEPRDQAGAETESRAGAETEADEGKGKADDDDGKADDGEGKSKARNDEGKGKSKADDGKSKGRKKKNKEAS